MPITFDGPNRVMILDDVRYSSAYIWSRWVDFHAANKQYLPAFRLSGGEVTDPTAGKYAPRFYYVTNDWGIRPKEADHDLFIDGYIVKDGGGSPFLRTLGAYQVNIERSVPAAAEAIATGGSTAPTVEQIVSGVLDAVYEGTSTVRGYLRLGRAMFAGLGKLPPGPGAFNMRDAANSKNRIAGTVDADGNRTSITVDET